MGYWEKEKTEPQGAKKKARTFFRLTPAENYEWLMAMKSRGMGVVFLEHPDNPKYLISYPLPFERLERRGELRVRGYQYPRYVEKGGTTPSLTKDSLLGRELERNIFDLTGD